MKRISLILTIVLFTFYSFSQSQINTSEVEIGDVFVIDNATDSFKHIDLPRPNIIIKRGGIANYDNIKGIAVEVTNVKQKNGSTIVTLIRPDGKRFFGSHKYIKADIAKALEAGELTSE